jgi:hypothetical protein
VRRHQVTQPPKSCPHCQSDRVHRSHRHGARDHLLHALGAEIRRCHECRSRHAAFATFSVPLSKPERTLRRRTGFVMASGFLVCLLFVWWIIRRFTELSG